MIDPHRSIFKFKGAVRNIPGNVRRHEVTESLRTVPENMGKGKIFKELRQRILFSQWVKRDMEISVENRTGKEKGSFYGTMTSRLILILGRNKRTNHDGWICEVRDKKSDCQEAADS